MLRVDASFVSFADRFVAHVLFVTPRAPRVDAEPDQLLGFAVLVSGARCLLRYAILPFGLPLLGLAAGTARGITIAFDLIAIVAAVTSLRRMWAVQHPQRWRYLLIAVGVFAFTAIFLAIDATVLRWTDAMGSI